MASAGVKKVFSMDRMANSDNRIRGLYIYHSAHTGRFAAGGFQPSRIRSIRVVFDRTPLGTVIMDDVGLNPGMDKKYLAARLNP